MADKNRVFRFVDQFNVPVWGLATRLSRGHQDTTKAEDERYPDKAGGTTFIGASGVFPSPDGWTVHVNYNEGLNPGWRDYEFASRHFADVEDLGAGFVWTVVKKVAPPIPPVLGFRNEFKTVQAVNRDYPGLITGQGGFVDQVAHRLNRADGVVRWGRKARNSDGTNPNFDGLTYLNDPANHARKIIVDIIVASDTPQATPSWQEYLGDNIGNGYWIPPITPDRDPK